MSTVPFLRRPPRSGVTGTPLPRPHLSHSQITKYETCPRQFYHYYVEGLRPAQVSASLVFGTSVHEALAAHFSSGEDPVSFFAAEWGLHEDDDLRYAGRDSWASLNDKGLGLMAYFLAHERDRLTKISGIESKFSVQVSSLPVPLVGVIDLVAELDGILTVIDWKTSSSSYGEEDVHLSDQLTTYTLAHPEIPDVAYGLFVKTKEPRFEWHRSRRTGEEVGDLLRKAERVVSDIQAGRFDKRPGDHCSYCDFLPLCLGRKAEAASTLTVPSPPS